MTRGGAARVKAARGEGVARSDGGMRQSRDEGQRVAKGTCGKGATREEGASGRGCE